MNFKEQIQQDIDAVFLNLDEFAERHHVEGKEIVVVVDDDLMNTLKKGQILGIVEAEMMLLGRVADFPADLDPGRLLNVDGREMQIVKSGKDMGLAEVALSQNRMG